MKPSTTPAARRRPAATIAALAIGLALSTGCGSDRPSIPLYPASGQVLVGDQPAAGVEIRLFDADRPTDPDAPHPYAATDADGRFRLSTFQDGDGAPVGRFSVMLLWPEGPPGPSAPRDRFHNAFTNPAGSPYRATLALGGTQLEPFRIDPSILKKTPKPDPSKAPANPAERK